MSYPHVTQFETLDRRARLAASAAPAPRLWRVRGWLRLGLRRRLTAQPC